MPNARHTGLMKCQKVSLLNFFISKLFYFYVKSQIINKLNMTAKKGLAGSIKPHQVPIITSRISFHLEKTRLPKNQFFM